MTPLPNIVPACPKCRSPLQPERFLPGQFAACPNCQAEISLEVFAALFRPIPRAAPSEAVMISGESTCFYHDAKRAVVVCDACGRFLCALCDCDINGQHFCPPCLETGQKKGALEQLETSRVLYGRQALILAILPFFLTGLAAILVAIRYWKSPGSLVSRRSWQVPVALVLGILQILAFSVLIIWAFTR